MRALQRAFSVLVLAAFLSQQAGAAAWTVTDTADAGAGSLRAAVTSAGAGDTVAWASGAGGTITLGSNLPNVAAGAVFDVSAATSAVTIAAQAIPLTGGLTCSNGTGGPAWTISSSITGTGPLTKTGSGSLALTGANTYTGGTAVTGGILNINTDATLGNAAGGVTLDGGTLQTAGALVSARGFTLNAGNGTVDTNGFDSTLSGVIAGAGSLTKTGSGVLTLSGANTYGGGTALNGGTLSITADNNLGAASGLTFNGGTLRTAAGLAIARNAVLGSGSGAIDTNGNNSTFSGVFSGTGGLTKAGAGTLTLSGLNTYTGGTAVNAGMVSISTDGNLGYLYGPLTLNGGSLQTTAGINSVRSIALLSGATFYDQGQSSTLAGGIFGAGSLTFNKTAGGTAVITIAAGNSYSGGTIVNGETLRISNASALGSGVVAFNGGTLQTASTVTFASPIVLNAGTNAIDTLGNGSFLTGVISGAGALTSVSTGTLYLTNSNTYAGGTVVSSGTLDINADAALGAAAGALTISGGTLQAGAANISSSRAIHLAAGTGGAVGGAIDTNGFKMLLSGVIDGAGGLTKMGAGTLTLSGANTYAGATLVSAGTLALGANGSLPAAAALAVNSGAAFDMGSFTQTVASYAGAGALKLVLQPAVTNLAVTGAANASNGTLSVNFTPQVAGALRVGDTFKPITAGGGGLTAAQAFASIVPPAAISLTPTYNNTDLTLTVGFVPFANTASGPNQTAVGAALEPLRASPTGDAATVLGNLYTLDSQGLRAALDQIGPVSLASMGSLGAAGSSAQSAAVGRRMGALADGSAPAGFTSYTVSGRLDNPGGPLLAFAGMDLQNLDLGAAREERTPSTPWGFFASGVASTGRLVEAHTDSNSQPGYTYNTGGVALGGDYRLNKNLAVGASAGYLHGHASVYAPGSGTADSDSMRFGLYGAAYDERSRAGLYMGGALDFFSTRRGIQFGQVSRYATAKPVGTEFTLSADGSTDFKTARRGNFTPFAGLDYTRLMIGSFSEQGADALDLRVDQQTADSLQSSMGLRYWDKLTTASCVLLPYVKLGWRHEFIDQSRPIGAQLANGGGSFTVATGSFARDGTIFGTGFSADWGKGLTARADYSGDFRSHYQDHSYSATLRYRF